MNQIEIKTLDILLDICKDETYKIIDADDILRHLEGGTAEELFDAIDNLNTSRHVAVKYSDRTEYCLCLTKTGIITAEEAREKRLKEEQLRREREKLRLEQAERERQEQELKNKKSILRSFRKKEASIHDKEPSSVAEEIAPESIETYEAEHEHNTGAVVLNDSVTDASAHNKSLTQSTIVLREVMLNRETMRMIARVAFFSGFIGAVLGSLIVTLIFVLI